MNDAIKTWLVKKRVAIAISIGLIFLIVIMGLIFLLFSKPKESEQTNESLTDYYLSQSSEGQAHALSNKDTQSIPIEDKNEEEESIFVDLKGAVQLPGVYEINSNMRLTDVIILAGGFLPTADQSMVNLSQKLSDQMMITIPEIRIGKEQEALSETEITGELPIIIKTPDEVSEKEGGRVNINVADTIELQTLSGIGEKKAERILQYRQEHGSFKTVEELKEVSGIGDKTFEALADFISVGKD